MRNLYDVAENNIVDFSAYRRRLLQEGSLAPKAEAEEMSFSAGWEDAQAEEDGRGMEERTVVIQLPAARQAVRASRPAWALDIAASVGVVLMTLAFAAQVLLL